MLYIYKKIKRTLLLVFLLIVPTIIGCENQKEIINLNDDIFKAESLVSYKHLSSYCNPDYMQNLQTVVFGRYPQNDITGKNSDPIEWYVLEKKKNYAILISKNILDYKKYNNNGENGDFAKSTLYRWLQDEFYDKAFNDSEKEFLKLKTNIIHIPSEKELSLGFGDISGRDLQPINYTYCISKATLYCEKIREELKDTSEKLGAPNSYWIDNPYKFSHFDNGRKIEVLQKKPRVVNVNGKGLTSFEKKGQERIYNRDADKYCGVRPMIYVKFNPELVSEDLIKDISPYSIESKTEIIDVGSGTNYIHRRLTFDDYILMNHVSIEKAGNPNENRWLLKSINLHFYIKTDQSRLEDGLYLEGKIHDIKFRIDLPRPLRRKKDINGVLFNETEEFDYDKEIEINKEFVYLNNDDFVIEYSYQLFKKD